MLVKSLLNEIFISIKSNKLRSFLTITGTAIGIIAVVLMIALGQTVQNEINSNLSDFNPNKVIVVPNYKNFTGGKGASIPILNLRDMEEIKTIPNIETVSPTVYFSANLNYETKRFKANIIGTNSKYFSINNRELESGKIFNEKDETNSESYIVIGKNLAKSLFDYSNPIGKVIKIKNMSFSVIGVMKEKGGKNEDDYVIMPIDTLKKKLYVEKGFYDNINAIEVLVDNKNNIDIVKAKIENLLRARHNIFDGKYDDFEIIILKDVINKINRISNILSIFLISIASISLFVGSIGIMNMMLVCVTERTKEIGIRKSVGAKKIDILKQFLLESIAFALLGSFIGIVIGVSISQVVGYFLEKSVPVSFFGIFICVIIAIIVGVLSGVLPAVRAAKMDPIEALK